MGIPPPNDWLGWLSGGLDGVFLRPSPGINVYDHPRHYSVGGQVPLDLGCPKVQPGCRGRFQMQYFKRLIFSEFLWTEATSFDHKPCSSLLRCGFLALRERVVWEEFS